MQQELGAKLSAMGGALIFGVDILLVKRHLAELINTKIALDGIKSTATYKRAKKAWYNVLG